MGKVARIKVLNLRASINGARMSLGNLDRKLQRLWVRQSEVTAAEVPAIVHDINLVIKQLANIVQSLTKVG